MKPTKLYASALTITTLFAAMPASAAPFLFELTGSRNATFSINSDTPADFLSSGLFGDQIAFNNVPGIFAGTQETASVGFGTNLFATLNIGAVGLGFTQFVGPDLFTLSGGKPVFNVGTFQLRSIISGASTLKISAVAAPVPEPATWALMILGFVMVGAASRYRRRKITIAYT